MQINTGPFTPYNPPAAVQNSEGASADRMEPRPARGRKVHRPTASTHAGAPPASKAAAGPGPTPAAPPWQGAKADAQQAAQAHERGLKLLAEGEHKLAEGDFRKAMKLDPKTPQYMLSLGLALLKQGNVDAGSFFCDEARARGATEPQATTAHLDAGRALLTQKKYAEAEAAFREGLRLAPDDVLLRCSLARSLVFQDKNNEAENVCREGIALDSSVPENHDQLARVLLFLKRFVEAEGEARHAIKLDPDTALYHARLGRALLRQKRHAAAVDAYCEAVRLDPQDAEHHSDLGGVFWLLDRNTEAEPAYKEALRIDPKRQFDRIKHSLVLETLQKHVEQEAFCRESIALFPDDSKAYQHLGRCLRAQGKLLDAEVAGREALVRDATDDGSHAELAATLTLRKKWKEAENAWLEAIRLKPKNHFYYNGLAGTHIDAESYLAASAALNKAIALRPSDGRIYRLLGIKCKNQSLYKEARKHLLKAIDLFQSNADKADSHFIYAQAWAAEGCHQQAAQNCQKSIGLDASMAPRVRAWAEELKTLAKTCIKNEDWRQFNGACTLISSLAEQHEASALIAGDLCAGEGSYGEAMRRYEKLVKAEPHNDVYWRKFAASRETYLCTRRSGYAEALQKFRNGDYDAAAKHIHNEFGSDVKNPADCTLLGQCHQSLGQYRLAVMYFERALDNGGHRDAKEGLRSCERQLMPENEYRSVHERSVHLAAHSFDVLPKWGHKNKLRKFIASLGSITLQTEKADYASYAYYCLAHVYRASLQIAKAKEAAAQAARYCVESQRRSDIDWLIKDMDRPLLF